MNKFNKRQLKNWEDAVESENIALLTEEELTDIAGAFRDPPPCYKKCIWGFCRRICLRW